MFTKINLEYLKKIKEEGGTLDTAIEKWGNALELQEARKLAGERVYIMSTFFNRMVNDGIYDDILHDVNAMIDRTQALMQQEASENTQNTTI